MKPLILPSAGAFDSGCRRNTGPGNSILPENSILGDSILEDSILAAATDARRGFSSARARSSVLPWPRTLLILLLGVIAGLAAQTPASQAQLYGLTQRVVQGRAVDANGQPQSNAIVYLQDEKTNEIRTFITREDGSYRFGQLSSDVDYRLWAKLQNLKSKARTISSFDSKKLFIFDLKLEPAK